MEVWDLFDSERKPLGRTWPRGDGKPQGTYHVVVGVWTLNTSGQILLTLRHPEKESYANTWENTGGSVISGESSLEGAIRELAEETGINAEPSELTLLGTCQETSAFIDTYIVVKDVDLEDLRLQPGETVAARWVSLDELYELANDGQLAAPVAERLYALQQPFEAALCSVLAK